MNPAADPARPDYFSCAPARSFLDASKLPALRAGEVEIARLIFASKTQAEVTSLRARRAADGKGVFLQLVDEYGTQFNLPFDLVAQPMTAFELLALLQHTSPPPMGNPMQMQVDSDFYSGLNDLARQLQTRQEESL